ncbi:lipase [bacterium]|nr:lipase [bacterium]|tara:strand:- start:258 stop:1097 length:840 start_codon:yes stop_codon:yes gene_type:complete
MPIFLLILITAVIIITAVFLYISKIIATLPDGRTQDYLERSINKNQRLIACIGDSLTHGNIGQSWVDYLRKEFPEDVFLNEGINGNTVWQVLQRIDPILALKPDIVILMIGSNDAMGSFDKQSGIRYMRNNKLPEVPTIDKFREHFLELIERMKEVPRIGLCTIPPVGENKDSMINNHVENFNDSIKSASNLNKIELLPVCDQIWLDISKRTYPLRSDYSPNTIPIMRRIFGGIFHHYLFRKSWNDIARSKGQWILFDHIHFNERGADVVFKLVKKFIS